jgi:hypothetical protein
MSFGKSGAECDLGWRTNRTGSGAVALPLPTASFDFITSENPDPRIAASGGANGTRVNRTGMIVAGTAPRYDYDPVTLAARGVLVEEARTNLFTNAAIDGTGLITQTVTVTAAPTTISFYGTGSITLSGAYSATIAGAGTYPRRTALTFTPAAGSLVCTVTGSCQWAQCETGLHPSSFIPSGAGPATRSADVLSITGTNFSSWFNPSAGTFAARADAFSPAAAGANCNIYQIDDGTIANRTFAAVGTVSDMRANVVSSNVPQGVLVTANSPTPQLPFGMAHAYAVNNTGLSLNGGAVVTGSAVTLSLSVIALRLGCNVGPADFLNGHLQILSYYNNRLTNAQLQTLSRSV